MLPDDALTPRPAPASRRDEVAPLEAGPRSPRGKPPVTRRARPAALAWLYVLLLVAWVAWGQLVAPGVIARAYGGDGLALLQRLLQAHGPRPLADYLEFWRRSVWTLAALWIGGGFGWWAITRPRFQRWWDATRGVAPDVRPAADLGRRRLACVQTFIVLLLAAQGAAIVSWLELWPFSPYKMFSETRRSSDGLTRYRVFGIPADDPATEIRITPGVLEPLHNSSVQQLVRQARRTRDPDQSLQALAGALLDFYEAGRRRATHRGPRLIGLRLYEDVWIRLDPMARDVERPHHRTLLAAARRAG
jgi:hypothetical protein